MFFHALTFDVAKGRCLKPWLPGQGFKLLPRDTANLNVKKETYVFVILAFSQWFLWKFQRNSESNINNKTDKNS